MAGPVGAWAFGPGDFWNKKPASEWSENEIKKLMTRSPWAKEATAQMNLSAGGMLGGRGGGGGRGGRGGGGGGGGMGGMDGGGGMGEGGFGEGGMGGGMRGGGQQLRLFVRWESAAPVVEARKRQRAPALDQYYLLSVSGLPMRPPAAAGKRAQQGAAAGDPEQRRAAMEARLKEGVRLQVKGRDPIAPAQVQRPNAQSGVLLLFFPRETRPVQLSDKEMVFSVKMDPIDAKVKFPLKDMVYRGELAL